MPTYSPEQESTSGSNTAALRTVLYVEDHPVNILLMQAMFAKRPELRLVVATTLEAGLLAAIEAKPDLLLLDLRLPDGDGVDLLRRMREVDHLREVFAVAVTAEAVSDLTREGFREIWHKPMDMHATLSRVDWLLMLGENEREEAAAAASAELPASVGWASAARSVRRPIPEPIPFPAAAQQLAESQRAVEADRAHSVATE